MAFDVILKFNKSEKNKMEKETETLSTFTGELKSETSIIDPVIMIECEMEQAVKANYMTISVFGRSYFINNIRSIRRGLVEFSCHVDVLSSFANEIRANKAIVKKQANLWNLYLNDGSFKVYQNPNVLTKPFPSGFTSQEFVLAVAGS